MKRIKGYRLHVNLGASQVRRRLKGLGCGVRKVESAGKNQAVVIHTATGVHLQELLAILQDAIAPSRQDDGSSSGSVEQQDEEQ